MLWICSLLRDEKVSLLWSLQFFSFPPQKPQKKMSQLIFTGSVNFGSPDFSEKCKSFSQQHAGGISKAEMKKCRDQGRLTFLAPLQQTPFRWITFLFDTTHTSDNSKVSLLPGCTEIKLRARCQIVLLSETGLNANRNFTSEQRLGITLKRTGLASGST